LTPGRFTNILAGDVTGLFHVPRYVRGGIC